MRLAMCEPQAALETPANMVKSIQQTSETRRLLGKHRDCFALSLCSLSLPVTRKWI